MECNAVRHGVRDSSRSAKGAFRVTAVIVDAPFTAAAAVAVVNGRIGGQL